MIVICLDIWYLVLTILVYVWGIETKYSIPINKKKNILQVDIENDKITKEDIIE